MRRRLSKLLIISLIAGTVAATEKPKNSEGKRYLKHTFSAGAVGRAGVGAGVTQATNTPREWGQGAAGFGKRLGSGFGKHLVKSGIQYPLAKAFHEEFGYTRSHKKGFGPRLKYALTATIITRKTTTGKRTVSKSELGSAFGSGMVSRLWQPASTRTIGAGFASGGIAIGADAAGNVAREFWPERHPHKGKVVRGPRQGHERAKVETRHHPVTARMPSRHA